MDLELKPCPFCGSTKLDISSKTVTGALVNGRKYRIAVYCKKCNAYGPRVVTGTDDFFKWLDEDTYDLTAKQAMIKWNERK